ncbi:DUF4254 domain-containing protein [Trichococcus shcherbakoviae]|uniref:DUF4254 domain-containing protein n=1 Tax=Trichococcus shcherbakoviae TaxID=2094020 RepID=UPI002AA6EF4F|nr:DUF4254 domain-containing protein [Trichococcus shcherbakoviae]
METLGSLVDKLTIANIRLWHLEDKRRNQSLPDDERLNAADAVSVVNSERNALIDEIDRMANNAVKTNVFPVVPKMKLY